MIFEGWFTHTLEGACVFSYRSIGTYCVFSNYLKLVMAKLSLHPYAKRNGWAYMEMWLEKGKSNANLSAVATQSTKILRPWLRMRPWLCMAKHWMLAHLVFDTTAQTAKKCHNSSGCFIRRAGLATRKLTKRTPFKDERKRKAHLKRQALTSVQWIGDYCWVQGQLTHQNSLIWMCAFS